jgi:hypothetical protein
MCQLLLQHESAHNRAAALLQQIGVSQQGIGFHILPIHLSYRSGRQSVQLGNLCLQVTMMYCVSGTFQRYKRHCLALLLPCCCDSVLQPRLAVMHVRYISCICGVFCASRKGGCAQAAKTPLAVSAAALLLCDS